jgi:hypothetical protein
MFKFGGLQLWEFRRGLLVLHRFGGLQLREFRRGLLILHSGVVSE